MGEFIILKYNSGGEAIVKIEDIKTIEREYKTGSGGYDYYVSTDKYSYRVTKETYDKVKKTLLDTDNENIK